MKRHLTRGLVTVAVLALATSALAGDWHSGVSLKCFDCHVMHYSQAHGYTPTGINFQPLGAGGPFHYLLRDDINNLCLACHDGGDAPDVFEGHGAGYVRQAGALNDVNSTGDYTPNTGHTLGSTADAPGSSPVWSNPDGLNCANCHAVHGGGFGAGWSGPAGSYRNLGGYGTKLGSGFGITYARGDLDGPNTGTNLDYWVFEDASGGTNGAHYGIDHVTFNEPDPTTSQYANACKACHTKFHGAVTGTEIGGVLVGTDYEEFKRHPAAGVDIGTIGGGHSGLARFVAEGSSQLQVMSPNGTRHGSYTATDTDLTPSCMTCHKAHGNQNAFGLIFVLGANAGGGAMTEQGDQGGGGDVRNSCRACHGQGGSETNAW
jgi:hypothetical protein